MAGRGDGLLRARLQVGVSRAVCYLARLQQQGGASWGSAALQVCGSTAGGATADGRARQDQDLVPDAVPHGVQPHRRPPEARLPLEYAVRVGGDAVGPTAPPDEHDLQQGAGRCVPQRCRAELLPSRPEGVARGARRVQCGRLQRLGQAAAALQVIGVRARRRESPHARRGRDGESQLPRVREEHRTIPGSGQVRRAVRAQSVRRACAERAQSVRSAYAERAQSVRRACAASGPTRRVGD